MYPTALHEAIQVFCLLKYELSVCSSFLRNLVFNSGLDEYCLLFPIETYKILIVITIFASEWSQGCIMRSLPV